MVDGDWVFVAGTTGFDYESGRIDEDVVAQARQCLRNIEQALTEAGFVWADIVRVRYILPDAADFEPCWPVLRSVFGAVRPAATMIQAGLADPRMKIEIEVTGRRLAPDCDQAACRWRPQKPSRMLRASASAIGAAPSRGRCRLIAKFGRGGSPAPGAEPPAPGGTVEASRAATASRSVRSR